MFVKSAPASGALTAARVSDSGARRHSRTVWLAVRPAVLSAKLGSTRGASCIVATPAPSRKRRLSDRAGWHRATRSKGGFDVTYKPGDTEKSSARPCPWLARRKHLHYLKGTIRCGTCSCRLVYSRNKGNGGIYEYFVCPRKQRGECPQGYQPDDLVEAAVEDYYAGVPFSETEREEIRKAISKDLGERVAAAQQEIDCCQGVLKAVKEEERKLLNMHYEDRISAELFDDEQVRLRAQREDAEALTARLNLRYDDIVATFELALEILDEDLQTCTYEPTTLSEGSSTRPSSTHRSSATKRSLPLNSPARSPSYTLCTVPSAASPPPQYRRRSKSSPQRPPDMAKLPSHGWNGSLWPLVRLARLWWS